VTNLIGRAADNSICLDDSTISAYHVRLSFQGGQWWLEDLGSRNGTGVNDLAIEEPLVVTYGDRIRVGRVEMKLSAGDPPEEGAGK
jgi:pSer/pThr/pTyr-binding forkhead associated (FHA) protein